MLRGRFLEGDTTTLFCGSVSVVGPSSSVAVGAVAVGVAVAVDVAVDVARVDVPVDVVAGVDANIASSGDTVHTVGLAGVTEELAVDGWSPVDGAATVDGLAVGLCHGG